MEHISSMLSPVLCAQLTKLLDFNGQFYRQTFAKGFFIYYFFNSKLLGCKTVWAPETISRIGRPCSIASRYAEHRRTQETDYDMLQPRKWCGLEGESPKMALSIFNSTIWSKLLARYTYTSARLHLVPSAPLFPHVPMRKMWWGQQVSWRKDRMQLHKVQCELQQANQTAGSLAIGGSVRPVLHHMLSWKILNASRLLVWRSSCQKPFKSRKRKALCSVPRDIMVIGGCCCGTAFQLVPFHVSFVAEFCRAGSLVVSCDSCLK